MRLKIQARIRQRPATGTPRQSRLARASLHLFAAQRSRRPERILPQKPGERTRPPPPPNATEKASSARDPGRPRYRETAGLERQNEASKGDQDEQPGAQKRKKGPKALFSSTQAETWIMFGAGNETCTRTVSRCFPNTFFVGLASEDLNCSLVFRPRQQIRPKSSTDVQRAALSTPDPRSVHRRRRLPRTHHPRPVVCPASIIVKTIRQMVLVMAQVGCWERLHHNSQGPSAQAPLKERARWPPRFRTRFFVDISG